MSKTKVVHVLGRKVWAYDTSHDIVVGRLVEIGRALGVTPDATQQWAVWASIPDLGFTYRTEEIVGASELRTMLAAVRDRVIADGDLDHASLEGWSVLDGYDVSLGIVRGGHHPVEATLDFLDGLMKMASEALDPAPEGTWWFLGAPSGRSTIRMVEDAE